MSAEEALHLYDCNGEVVSASSPEDAAELFLNGSGETAQAMTDDPSATWAQIPDDKEITVKVDDSGKWEKVKKTAAEWAKEIGRGMAWSNNE